MGKHVASKRGKPKFDGDLLAQPVADRPTPRSVAAIEAKTPAQKRYITAIKSSAVTFATGPAGTGKTWLATALACQALINREIETIIITRPAVEVGESLGFLPGELEEKFSVYLEPLRGVLYERLGKGFAEYLIKMGKIEAAPLAYMRGRTLKNAFVILDEAQNTTPKQMQMFLTRIGEGSKMVINGDLNQQDITGESGLFDAIMRVGHIPSVQVIQFSRNDIVRSGLVGEFVLAYDQPRPLKSHGLE